MATSKSNMTLKLLVNKTEGKVLFAEANKEFVDFLFCIPTLPVGSIVKLGGKSKNTVGCLGELYQSIEALSETYMLSNQNKDSVLNPKSPLCPTQILLLQQPDDYNEPKKFYTCSHHYGGPLYVTDTPDRSCPYCQGRMDREMQFISTDTSTAAAEKGFVKDTVSYMVMDNLEVKPMSTISCITLINKFNVKDLGSLEERIVDFGPDESLKLVKASMEINNVLTSVFLGKIEDSAPSNNNDQMNTEDSMAEDTVPTSTPAVPAFGQQPISPPSSFVFGPTTSSGANPFPFGSQQTLVTPQNPSPFQALSSLDFNAGGSCSLGTGGRYRSQRRMVKVRKPRKK